MTTKCARTLRSSDLQVNDIRRYTPSQRTMRRPSCDPGIPGVRPLARDGFRGTDRGRDAVHALAGYRGLPVLQERWRPGEEPHRNQAVEHHAPERRTRHERPDRIAPQVMSDIPGRVHQPAAAD